MGGGLSAYVAEPFVTLSPLCVHALFQGSVSAACAIRRGLLPSARACEALGAGEILLNCINKDGTNSGFDCGLVRAVKQAVGIPVIASSGAGKPEHFSEVFAATNVEAALAAGIFHRSEVPISAVKQHLQDSKFPIRRSE